MLTEIRICCIHVIPSLEFLLGRIQVPDALGASYDFRAARHSLEALHKVGPIHRARAAAEVACSLAARQLSEGVSPACLCPLTNPRSKLETQVAAAPGVTPAQQYAAVQQRGISSYADQMSAT
jgi:hypothetical protein